MRLYSRSRDDQINACKRCGCDAANGRLKLALERFADIIDEGPRDKDVEANVRYNEGVVRRDYLGQGFKARALFERAYALKPRHSSAVINAALVARNADELRESAEIFRSVVPKSETRAYDALHRRLQALERGAEYWVALHDIAFLFEENGAFGQAASVMELALANHELPPDEEAGKRRWRAQQLRRLDEAAEQIRKTRRESFPPDERLALHEALAELERALALDPYDPEMWNLRSAWCMILERFEQAVDSANKAIELRPHEYAKPHINKAIALWELKKHQQALASAKEAAKQALEAGDSVDEESARRLEKTYSCPPVVPSLGDFRPLFQRMLAGSKDIADREAEALDYKPDVVTGGFWNRCRKRLGSRSDAYVDILAELFSDFCPERALFVVSALARIVEFLKTVLPGPMVQDSMTVAREGQAAYDHCLHAALYVVAHSAGVQQRDAARFYCLVLFGALEPDLIRRSYRESILETSAAAADEMSRLDSLIRDELGRIHSQLPHLIADQAPVDQSGRERAARNILSRFSGGTGCSMNALGILLLIVAGILGG